MAGRGCSAAPEAPGTPGERVECAWSTSVYARHRGQLSRVCSCLLMIPIAIYRVMCANFKLSPRSKHSFIKPKYNCQNVLGWRGKLFDLCMATSHPRTTIHTHTSPMMHELASVTTNTSTSSQLDPRGHSSKFIENPAHSAVNCGKFYSRGSAPHPAGRTSCAVARTPPRRYPRDRACF